ncbi:MAG: hypothetical protein DCC49_13710 [Acidobacteria bacterium]|nr:MAG: hypothetical protein DCC49_13710 [Acidobacteriota bacterium]
MRAMSQRLRTILVRMLDYLSLRISLGEGLAVLAIAVPMSIATYYLLSLTLLPRVLDWDAGNVHVRRILVQSILYGPPAMASVIALIVVRRLRRDASHGE